MFMKYWLFGYRLNYRVKIGYFYCQMPSDCIDFSWNWYKNRDYIQSCTEILCGPENYESLLVHTN